MKEDLLYSYFTGTLTDAETQELMLELEHNEELKKEFKELKALNSLVDFSAQKEDKKIGSKKYVQFVSKQKPSISNHILKWRRVANYAAVILITFTITYFTSSYLFNVQNEENIAYFEFSTPAGQRAKMKLPDGSTVWLNAKSTLRYPSHFSKENRKVELDGEGYFEITHNAQKPFIVSTNKADVKVLGTSFNVFAYNDSPQFTASLVEGSIDVSLPGHHPDHSAILKPNQMVTVEGHDLIVTELPDLNNLLWKDGIYVFDNLLLSEIIDKLELYYDIDIVMGNKDVKLYRFSGKFRQRDGVESVLKVLSDVKYFKFIKDSDKNEITIY